MTSARDALQTLLTDHIPPAVVMVPYSTNIDAPQKSTVMLRLDEVTPGIVTGQWNYKFGLVLIAGNAEAGPGDDELEALLEDVLLALDKVSAEGGVTWSPPARRGVYGKTPDTPTNPSFEVDVIVAIKKE